MSGDDLVDGSQVSMGMAPPATTESTKEAGNGWGEVPTLQGRNAFRIAGVRPSSAIASPSLLSGVSRPMATWALFRPISGCSYADHAAPWGPGQKSSCSDPLLPGAEVIGPVVNPVGLRGCQRLHAPPGNS